MNRLLSIFLLTTLTIAAQGQKTSTRLCQVDEYLQQQGFIVKHLQETSPSGNIHHQWLSVMNTPVLKPFFDILGDISEEEKQYIIHDYDSINASLQRVWDETTDSLRITFAQQSKEASESYQYEYHKNGIDSVMYSLAYIRKKNDSIDQSPNSHQVDFSNTREAANFTYTKNGSIIIGTLLHFLLEENGLACKDMKPFDVAGFEASIQPALASVTNLKGVKTHPVYWQHDEGFDDHSDHFTVKTMYGNDKHYGVTTGKFIFIPNRHKDKFTALFHRLDSLSQDYVDRHPEQLYSYHSSYPYGGKFLPEPHIYHHLSNTVIGRKADGVHEYYHFEFFTNEEGFYVRITNTKGERWIPKDWQKLKSYINGKKTFIGTGGI